jgi:hypothetical protein
MSDAILSVAFSKYLEKVSPLFLADLKISTPYASSSIGSVK